MKKLFIILSIFAMSCQASRLPVRGCDDKCPRPETMASTLPESTRTEIFVGTVLVGGLVILFLSSIDKAEND